MASGNGLMSTKIGLFVCPSSPPVEIPTAERFHESLVHSWNFPEARESAYICFHPKPTADQKAGASLSQICPTASSHGNPVTQAPGSGSWPTSTLPGETKKPHVKPTPGLMMLLRRGPAAQESLWERPGDRKAEAGEIVRGIIGMWEGKRILHPEVWFNPLTSWKSRIPTQLHLLKASFRLAIYLYFSRNILF